jgi:hypothetical protein
VAVPIFANNDFHRGVEFRLTEAVIKQLEARAPYKVVPRERADTILEGQINKVSLGSISRDYQTNLVREQILVILMDLTWKDLRTGQVLLQRKNFSRQGCFIRRWAKGSSPERRMRWRSWRCRSCRRWKRIGSPTGMAMRAWSPPAGPKPAPRGCLWKLASRPHYDKNNVGCWTAFQAGNGRVPLTGSV